MLSVPLLSDPSVQGNLALGQGDVAVPVTTEEKTCAICLNILEEGQRLLGHVTTGQIPVPHVFHAECLESALQQATKCPLCRANLSDLAVELAAQEGVAVAQQAEVDIEDEQVEVPAVAQQGQVEAERVERSTSRANSLTLIGVIIAVVAMIIIVECKTKNII